MIVQISLFGFGDERPRAFGSKDHLAVTMADRSTLDQTLRAAGFDPASGITVMRNNQLVAKDSWAQTVMENDDSLTVLMAIEGG